MEIITIASAKGGVSKSLLAINLFDYLKNEEENRELFKSEGVAVINSTLNNSVVYVNSSTIWNQSSEQNIQNKKLN